MPAMPMPSSAKPARMCQTGASGVSTREIAKIDTAVIANPPPVSTRGWTLSVKRPTIGARMMDITAIGTRSMDACSGEYPRTSWA